MLPCIFMDTANRGCLLNVPIWSGKYPTSASPFLIHNKKKGLSDIKKNLEPIGHTF